MPNGGQAVVEFATFGTGSLAIFGTGGYASGTINNAPGDDALFLRRPGSVILALSASCFAAPANDQWSVQFLEGASTAFPQYVPFGFSGATTGGVRLGTALWTPKLLGTSGPPWWGRIRIENFTGGAISVDVLTLRALYFGFGGPAQAGVY